MLAQGCKKGQPEFPEGRGRGPPVLTSYVSSEHILLIFKMAKDAQILKLNS